MQSHATLLLDVNNMNKTVCLIAVIEVNIIIIMKGITSFETGRTIKNAKMNKLISTVANKIIETRISLNFDVAQHCLVVKK